MKKNDTIQLAITDMGVNGEGIGKAEGYTFFVKNAVIGDKVSAVITKMNKGYGYAKTLQVLKASPDRVDPPCPEAARCGGCQIMELSYPAQLRYKEQKVRNNLERLGGLDLTTFEFLPIIGMDSVNAADAQQVDGLTGRVPLHYRNKMQYPFGRTSEGRIVTGFYAGRTHYLIETDNCPVALPGDEKIRQAVCSFAERNGLSVYDEESGKGLLRHLLIRRGSATGQVMVCLVINGDCLERESAEKSTASREKNNALEQQLVDKLQEADSAICSICLNINKEKTNVILGKTIRCLCGEPYIEEEITCGPETTDNRGTLRFRISPLSFFQVNTKQTEKLYSTALSFADLKGDETVWDLYCGTGTISLFVAGVAKKVIGVEVIPAAIENAKENARLNGIDNADFLCGRSEELFPEAVLQNNEPADVVILDPPRKGCDAKLLDAIRKVGPEKIVYVSCDSATLARDLKILTGTEPAEGNSGTGMDGKADAIYKVEKVQPVDMFPNTIHCEAVVLMTRRTD